MKSREKEIKQLRLEKESLYGGKKDGRSNRDNC